MIFIFIIYDQNGSYYPPVVTTTLNPAAGTYNVVGTWMASTTACASQYLDVWQNTGLESHRELSLHGVFPITSAPIYATTSGAFNFTFDIIDSSVSVGATSTTYSLTPSQQFYAQLYQSSCGYNPFTGTRGGSCAAYFLLLPLLWLLLQRLSKGVLTTILFLVRLTGHLLFLILQIFSHSLMYLTFLLQKFLSHISSKFHR